MSVAAPRSETELGATGALPCPTIASAGRGATVRASLRAATALSELCEAATPRAAATREEWGRDCWARAVAMAETALSHGTIMHIHELQALGAEAVGKSVRVLGA